MTILVKLQNVYGTLRIYPANRPGELLAALLKKKTFDSEDIRLAKSLGLKFEVSTEPGPELKDVINA